MKKKLEITGFLLGWFAVITQFILIILYRQTSIIETIIRFFSFFTILTNLLVTLFFTVRIFDFSGKIVSIFNKKETVTSITTFILIVGIVYQIVLRGIWNPEGMQLIVDELLHSIIPLFVLFYWVLFSVKEKNLFKNAIVWLIYPLIYLLFVLLRGSFSDYYPYSFLNISQIGIGKVLLNSGIVLALILFVMSVLIFIKNKQISNKTNIN
jgi:hypothetical protein